jgi:phage-related protein
MLAALVPATGSAAQAGNALKTIFSRLISPTKETTEVLGLMGIHIDDMSWKSATMTDRLITMAKKFETLSSAQKGVVSSVAASRWQVNKFEVLMRELINTNGYYQRALRATADDTSVFNQMNKEMQAVLSSNPRRLQIIWTMLQNAMADIIQPLIPMILWLAEALQRMVTAFSELPQPIQLAVLGMLAFLAVVGPLVRIAGAMMLMVGQLGGVFLLLLAPIKMVLAGLWALISVPVMAFLGAMGFMARGAIVAVWAMVPGFKFAMNAIQIALLTGAAAAGKIWAFGLGALWTIASGAWTAIYVLYLRALRAIQVILVAGAARIGIIWRAMLAGLAAIQAAWTAVMAISWSAMFTRIGAIIAAGFAFIGTMFTSFTAFLRMASGAIIMAVTGPIGMAITAAVILVALFWDELKGLWAAMVRGTINAFNALPQGILGAMQAVVNIVREAVMAVYRLFSYLNPWAHHSPSLVENVTTGMDAVAKQFARAGNMGDAFKSAYKDMQRFGKALAALKSKSDASEFANMRKQIKGIDPGAIASFDRLVKALPKLKGYLASLKPALDSQVAVVAKWKDKLDAANDALDVQQKKLDGLEKTASGYQKQLDAAQSALDGFASAPIKGMKAMEDAIFDNEMQQKRLRLELMKMEEAVGPMDELESRIQSINGQIEMLSGEQAALRNAGAGSEILSVYDEQINLLEQQKTAIDQQLAPMRNLSNEIDELGRKAEMLDLEESLKFDPLKKAIDDAANSMKELPFDEIIEGVTKNKAEVDRLTEAYNKAQAAVDKQQSIVDNYKAQRDAVQDRYDAEDKALQKLQDQYSKYETQIRDIEQALRDAGSAADTLAQAKKKAGGSGSGGGGGMSPGAENFKAGAGGNFGDPGDFAQIGREGGLGDQASMIDEFTKEMAQKTKDMFGSFDFLGPVKKAWTTATTWLKTNLGPAFGEIGSAISAWWAGFDPFGSSSQSWIETATSIANSIGEVMKWVWEAIGTPVIELFKNAWAGLQDAFSSIQPEIEKFRDLVGPMGEALSNIWSVLKPVLGVIIALIMGVLSGLIKAVAEGIGPFISGIGNMIAGIIRIIRGIIGFITGVFAGDWGTAWQGIIDIFGGMWDTIYGLIEGAVGTIWGLIKGFVEGFYDFFVWLWDELVGHSIVPDIVNDIIAWIASMPAKVWAALSTLGAKFFTRAKDALKGMKDNIVSGWNIALAVVKGIPAAVWNALSTLGQKFRDRASTALSNMKTKVEEGWTAIKNKIGAWASSAYSSLSGLAGKVRDRASEMMSGFSSKITEKWTGIKSWFEGLGTKIKNAIGSVGSLLSGIGSSIMDGFLRGLKDSWGKVTDFVGGIDDWIKNNKGPIEKDRILLVDEGAAIMSSLGTGLRKQWPDVQNFVGGVAGQITSAMTAANALTSAVSRQATSTISGNTQGGGGQPQQVVNNFYGDLSFPSIDNESDAEEFLRNLEAITRSQ